MVKEITLEVHSLFAGDIANDMNLKVRERIIKNNKQGLERYLSN